MLFASFYNLLKKIQGSLSVLPESKLVFYEKYSIIQAKEITFYGIEL